MLEPDARIQLLQALRPPIVETDALAGRYELSVALGTSYSLDLETLLTLPLAFTIFDWQDQHGSPKADPLDLLHALRTYASCMCVFTQAGQVKIPRQNQVLYQNLEQAVVE